MTEKELILETIMIGHFGVHHIICDPGKETLKDKISAFSILSSHLQQHLLIIHL